MFFGRFDWIGCRSFERFAVGGRVCTRSLCRDCSSGLFLVVELEGSGLSLCSPSPG